MIVGVSGKAQTGKDTIGNILVKKYGFTRVASADALKRIARNIFGWDALKDERGRRFLQDLAMAVRGYNKDYWINLALQDINRSIALHGKENVNFVVTDVRFLNEVEYLKDHGATIIRINRPDVPKLDHVSETELDDYTAFNFVIENTGTINDLEKDIDTIYGALNGQKTKQAQERL